MKGFRNVMILAITCIVVGVVYSQCGQKCVRSDWDQFPSCVEWTDR